MRLGLDCSRFGSCFWPEKIFLLEWETECRTKSFLDSYDFHFFRQHVTLTYVSAGFCQRIFSTDPWVVVSKRYTLWPHRVGGNRKRCQQSTNADQKSIETVFSIVICCQCGDKWQSKTLFLTIFLSTFLDSVDVFRLPPTWCDSVFSSRLHLDFGCAPFLDDLPCWWQNVRSLASS